ncbi:MAG: ABC-F family ATP-binding cassette domain-containing protein [Selenomonadaceae bacterium]|nr:ABC-F family ATP-binding cassette domain-containing protein [Selenomonadaceae bacterium]
MVQIENLTKSYGERTIFSDVNFKIMDGEKVGIVGKNGAGKSTLIKIMVGLEEYDGGKIFGLRAEDIGYAEQIPHFTKNNLLDEMTSNGVQEFQAKKILFGLGFTESELKKNPNEFSGGETAKISLAKSLLSEPRILILDEPTNHLDIYAIDFLEELLKNYRGTVIAVTHDRHFLQNCVDKILDMENGHAILYPGNYEKFVQLKEERREYELKAYEKQQEEISKLEDFVRRNKTRASTAKRARSRQNILDRMERLEKPPTNETVKLNLRDASESANRVLIIEKINFKNVIKNFSAEILKGEKIGLIGKNGVGKSTLLKIIVGELKSDSGEIKIGNRVKIGYLSQGHEELNENFSAIEELIEEFNLTTEKARSELAKLNIFAEVADKKISAMSGGEKTRVALAKLILTGANFLILDEPTNHLDLPAREAIENALKNFDGTVLIVTHDRYLLEEVTTRTITMRNEELGIRNEESVVEGEKVYKPKNLSDKKISSAKIKNPPKKEIQPERIEAQIKMAEMELKMIEHEINSATDPAKLTELAAAHEKKLQEIDELLEIWVDV